MQLKAKYLYNLKRSCRQFLNRNFSWGMEICISISTYGYLSHTNQIIKLPSTDKSNSKM